MADLKFLAKVSSMSMSLDSTLVGGDIVSTYSCLTSRFALSTSKLKMRKILEIYKTVEKGMN